MLDEQLGLPGISTSYFPVLVYLSRSVDSIPRQDIGINRYQQRPRCSRLDASSRDRFLICLVYQSTAMRPDLAPVLRDASAPIRGHGASMYLDGVFAESRDKARREPLAELRVHAITMGRNRDAISTQWLLSCESLTLLDPS